MPKERRLRMKLSEQYDDIRGVKIVDPPVRSVSIKSEVAKLEARLASARAIMQRFVNKVDDIDKDEMIDVEDICVEMKEWLDDQT